MRLTLSIAICSFVLTASSFAGVRIVWGWSGSYNERVYDRQGSLAISNDNLGPATSYTRNNLDAFDFSVTPAELQYQRFEVQVRWTNNEYYTFFAINQNTDAENNAWTAYVDTNGVAVSVNPSGDKFTVDGNAYAPSEIVEWEWELGEHWGGAQIEIRDDLGNTVWFGVVPEGGGVLVGNFERPGDKLLSDYGVYIDGVRVDDVLSIVPEGWPDDVADRPGFDFVFDSTYGTSAVRVQGQDGSVLFEQEVPEEVSNSVTGRVTVVQGESATVWTRASVADGIETWIPTNVQLSGSGTTVFYFSNNPEVPAPDPFPTPIPAPSPSPVIVEPGTNAQTSPTVTTNSNTNVLTDIDAGSIELGSLDDGEEGVLEDIASLQGILAETVGHLSTAQTNMVAAATILNGLRLSGVGRNCTFNFGPAEITLQTSGAVRAGLKLLIIGIAAFAAAGMLRNAIQ